MPNQIAIVTGVSHKHGIGAATCLELAKAGVIYFLPIGNQTVDGLKHSKGRFKSWG